MPDYDLTPAPEPKEPPTSKGLFQSKTFWFNLMTAVVSILVTIQDSELVVNNPQVVAILGLVVGIVNVVLRVLSGTPVKGFVSPKKK